MAKKGTYNGSFFGSFAERIHGTPIRFGILIGTEVEEERLRDVVFAAPTPPKPDEDGQPTTTPKDIVALAKSKASGDFAAWAQQHAAALQKLLPGGFGPCGCFAVVPEAEAKDISPMLNLVLKDISEPLVLTVDERSRKLSFWQHNASAKPNMRPAQLKADPHKDALLLWCATPVDFFVPRSPDLNSEGGARGEAVDKLVNDIEKGVAQALRGCTVGVEAATGVPLSLVDAASEAPVSSVVPKDCQELHVSYMRSGTAVVAAPNPEQCPCVRLRCLLVGTAVLLRRSGELRKAVEVLRESLASSAAHRLQLALDEAEGGAKGRLHLPWRALCKPDGSELPFWCGDYVMPDEDIGAARERLGQLLGVGESAFEAAPDHLDEQLRFSREHPGTYNPPEPEPEDAAPAPKTAGGGGLALPAAACGLAVVALALATLVPVLMRT